MLAYLGRCLVQLAVTVIGIVTVAFFLMRAIPGDPAAYMLGDYATKEALATLRAQLGLDRSLIEQYLLFIGTGGAGRPRQLGRDRPSRRSQRSSTACRPPRL